MTGHSKHLSNGLRRRRRQEAALPGPHPQRPTDCLHLASTSLGLRGQQQGLETPDPGVCHSRPPPLWVGGNSSSKAAMVTCFVVILTFTSEEALFFLLLIEQSNEWGQGQGLQASGPRDSLQDVQPKLSLGALPESLRGCRLCHQPCG